jgi:hypothetical protein
MSRASRSRRTDVEEDDDPVDHKLECEEKCMPKCEKFVKAYEACAERIKGDETGEAHCTVRDAMRRDDGWMELSARGGDDD